MLRNLMVLSPLVLSLLAGTSLSAQVRTARPPEPPVTVLPYIVETPHLATTIHSFVDIPPMEAINFSLAETRFDIQHSLSAINNLTVHLGGHADLGAPIHYAPNDPADSLYRAARDLLNRGDYRRAAALFKEVTAKYPNSSYGPDAMYWEANSLYWIGGTPELQEALTVLEALKAKYPGTSSASPQSRSSSTTTSIASSNGQGFSYSSSSRNRNDADALAARIAGVLSTRGMSENAAVKRALAAGGDTCNRDDQAVKVEALNALMQTDPEQGRKSAAGILARKDECSVQLRRNAVMMIGNRPDAQSTATLINVAKTDASSDVRAAAAEYLSRAPGDEALAALEDLFKTSTDERVQRAAVRALASNSSLRARAAIRAVVEKNDAPEQFRTTALDAISGDRATAEDAAWLRSTYPKVTSPRVRERIASAIGRMGGEANNQWLMDLARNDNEPASARMSALRRVSEGMDVAALSRFYDNTPQRSLRESIIRSLGDRKEPEALDKIVDIIKNATDPDLKRQAIQTLSNNKSPRATQLLMEILK